MIMNTRPADNIVTPRTIDESREFFMESQDEGGSCFFGVKCVTDCDDPLHHAPDEGNNVIIILLESFENFMIHPIFTPALYSLRQQSIVFNNFHGNNKTDVSETSVILGSYPMHMNLVPAWYEVNGNYNGDTRNPNVTREFPFSLPNMLKRDDSGFGVANYFLNHDGVHYSRTFTHPSYGFDGTFFVEDFPIGPEHCDDETRVWRSDWSWFTPEAEFLQHAIAEGSFLPEDQDKPFLTFFSTINAHGVYQLRENLPDIYYEKHDFITQEITEHNYFEDLQDRLNATQFAHFKMAMTRAMVADDGIAYLLYELENRGLADNTTILAFSDHNAYMNDVSTNVKDTGRNSSPAFKIPAFLFSPQLAKGLEDGLVDEELLVTDKFMVHFDFVPTLFNVLGIEFNQRMYLGFHAFDERENIVISRLGPASVFNDLFATDGMRILWQSPDATAFDLVTFRGRYLDMVNRWGYVNNLYSPAFQHP